MAIKKFIIRTYEVITDFFLFLLFDPKRLRWRL